MDEVRARNLDGALSVFVIILVNYIIIICGRVFGTHASDD
jgi:hypothetical protein